MDYRRSSIWCTLAHGTWRKRLLQKDVELYMLLEWIVSFHHLQQQIQRKKSPLLLFAVYTDKITTCIQDSIEKLHSSSTPERDLTGLLGLHCKLKLGTLSNIAGLLYSGAC
ncbi:hypothetical protein CLOM_g12543 [Closterium sp. NIES-68]|nr:hypothetical protein CLOM_g12543 [Closterium sp. NIES-68]